MSEEEQHIRNQMKKYWLRYSPTVDSMMLSDDGLYRHECDRDEIFSYLPDYKGKRVLELGAGVGRFTGRLAQLAQHVTAVDFIQEFVDMNKKENGCLNNITFKCSDVTQLEFPSGSFDLVFSNSLFMYLSDEEIAKAFEKILRWLSPGGYFFLREACYHAGGNFKRETNPTIYRTPMDYFQALLKTSLPNEVTTFKIICAKNLLTFIQNYGNPNQLCFLAKKVAQVTSSDLAQYIQMRYTLNNIMMGERIFGYLWFSTGSEATNREMCIPLGLKPNQKVLDVGCGPGGNAFFMARHYSVKVHGIDLSPSMIHLAIERQGKMEPGVRKKVQFEVNDILTVDCEEATYDVIYSRDVILFVAEKEALFKKLYTWLKPGGILFFTDHCRGPAPDTDDFVNNGPTKRRYTLVTEQAQREVIQGAGFKNVHSEDMTSEFIRTREADLRFFISGREAFIQDFSEEKYEEHRDVCSKWIRWAKNRQFTWATFKATK